MNQSILFLLRRLGFYLMAAFAALTLNFFIPRLMPGDPATIIFARFRGKLKPEAIDALRETFGLNDASLIDQYFLYLKSILSGDLGISIAYFPQEVSSVISGALMWTVFLAGICMWLSSKLAETISMSLLSVIQRVFGLLLGALAIEYVISGIKNTFGLS